MAVSYTYGDMQNRIADELWGRSDLLTNASNMTTAPIPLAIQSAIRIWERQRFYFNEIRTTSALTTVASQELYTSSDAAWVATVAHIDKLSITVSGNRLPMNARSAQYMEDISVNASNTGQPEDYSYYGETLRLYPIPDSAYAITAHYTKRLSELVLTTDTNAWVNDAEELIRSQAKMILYRDTLRDTDGYAAMKEAVSMAASVLKSETMRRVATTRMTPSYF